MRSIGEENQFNKDEIFSQPANASIIEEDSFAEMISDDQSEDESRMQNKELLRGASQSVS